MGPLMVMAAISGVSLVSNLFSGQKASRRQRRQQRQMMDALRADQDRWDKLSEPVQTAVTGYLSGTETSQQRAGREMAVASQAGSALSLVAPAVQADYAKAGQTLRSDLSLRGLGDSGVGAKAVADLEGQRVGTLASMRQQSVAGAQSTHLQAQQNYLRGLGPRPSLAGGLQTIAQTPEINTQLDISGLTQTLMSLAAKKPETTSTGGLFA